MEKIVKLGREAVVQASMRLGTALSVWLVAQGVPADNVGQLEMATAIVAALCYDYVAVKVVKLLKRKDAV